MSRDWPASLAVPPEELDRQIRRALQRGYIPVTFAEALAGTSDRKLVAVTFDDSYLSVYESAFPVLRELDVPATVFVPSRQVDPDRPMAWPGIDGWLDGEWRSELTGTSWEQLGALAEAGWEIGSHTRTHPALPEIDDEQLAIELEGSRSDCERLLGRPCTSIAYPYGAFDDRVVAAARRAGYEAGATLASRAALGDQDRDPLRWPRVAVYRGDSVRRIEAKAWLLTRRPRAWNALLATRLKLGR